MPQLQHCRESKFQIIDLDNPKFATFHLQRKFSLENYRFRQRES